MPDYEEAQNDTMDRFANLAKLAKLRRRDFNLASGRGGFAELEKLRDAGEACDYLIGFATECLALEVQKRGGFTPELQGRFDRVGTLLDRHIDPGEGMADKRRAVLERAEIHAKAHRDDDLDHEEISRALNRRTMRAGRSWVLLKNGPVRRTATEPRFSGTLGRGFNPAEARELVDALAGLHAGLAEHARQLDHFFEPVADVRRDDIGGFRNEPALSAEIGRLAGEVRRREVLMAEEWQQNALGRVDRELEARRLRDREMAAETDSFLSGRSESSPAPRLIEAGRRPVRPGSSDEEDGRPAQRPRLEDRPAGGARGRLGLGL